MEIQNFLCAKKVQNINLAFGIELQSNHSSPLTPKSLSKELKHRLENKHLNRGIMR